MVRQMRGDRARTRRVHRKCCSGFDVRGDVLVLVRSPREVIRESSSGGVDGGFGLDASCSSNGSKKGT